MREGSPRVARLFPDYKAVEREWFTRTGIFPIAHVLVVRRTLLDDHPGLAPRLYEAFVASKALALQSKELGRITNFTDVMVPRLNDLVQENRELDDHDWWAYGVQANHHAVDTFLRHHFEQGLSQRRWAVEDIFARDVLET